MTPNHLTPERLALLRLQRLTVEADTAAIARNVQAEEQARLAKAHAAGRSLALERMSYAQMRHVVAAGAGLRAYGPGIVAGVAEAVRGFNGACRAAFAAGVATVLAEIDGSA